MATLVLVKAIAAVFVVVGILWYRADDRPAADIFSSVQEKPLYSEAGFPIDPITGDEIFEEPVGEDLPRDTPEPPPVKSDEKLLTFRSTSTETVRHRRGAPLRSQLPEDAEPFSEEDAWTVFYSRSDQSFHVQSTDYHPKPFRLTRDKMTRMTDRIRQDNSDEGGEV